MELGWLEKSLDLTGRLLTMEQWKKAIPDWAHYEEVHFACVLLQVSRKVSTDTLRWLGEVRLRVMRSKEFCILAGEIEDVSREERKQRTFLGSCTGSSIGFSSSSSVNISHRQVGGVLDQDWTIWVN
jgi:hypothetical protein